MVDVLTDDEMAAEEMRRTIMASQAAPLQTAPTQVDLQELINLVRGLAESLDQVDRRVASLESLNIVECVADFEFRRGNEIAQREEQIQGHPLYDLAVEELFYGGSQNLSIEEIEGRINYYQHILPKLLTAAVNQTG